MNERLIWIFRWNVRICGYCEHTGRAGINLQLYISNLLYIEGLYHSQRQFSLSCEMTRYYRNYFCSSDSKSYSNYTLHSTITNSTKQAKNIKTLNCKDYLWCSPQRDWRMEDSFTTFFWFTVAGIRCQKMLPALKPVWSILSPCTSNKENLPVITIWPLLIL